MSAHERRRRPRLTEILAMASTASAMSLSNFQVITSSSVPLACLLAYNNPIVGCTGADFTQGRTCSATCVRDIQRVEANIRAACDGVSAPDTVLGQAILGNLVNLLCPSGNPPAATEAVDVATTTRQILTLTALPPSAIPPIETSATTSETVPIASQPPPPPPPPQEATQVGAPPSESNPLAINPTEATGARQTSNPSQSTSDDRTPVDPFDVSAEIFSASWQLTPPRIGTFLAAIALGYLLT